MNVGQAVNQRRTCVNKPKKKRRQVGTMKEYWQVPAAVESVGNKKARSRATLQTEGCSSQWPPFEQPKPRCRRSAAMFKGGSWVNIAVCPCLHPSLTHHRNINPFENKVWEIHIFKKKCVRSFIEVRKLCLIMCPYIFIFVCGYTTLRWRSLTDTWTCHCWTTFKEVSILQHCENTICSAYDLPGAIDYTDGCRVIGSKISTLSLYWSWSSWNIDKQLKFCKMKKKKKVSK